MCVWGTAEQARGVTERNLRLLLERCQACLQKLSDMQVGWSVGWCDSVSKAQADFAGCTLHVCVQFPLIQSIESCDVSVSELEALGSAEVAAQRRKLYECLQVSSM